MDYDALMAFATFSEYANFTRAAKALGLSQPALHVKVNKLGEELGVTLYVRRGRGLEITPEGIKLAAHARQIASMSQDVIAQLTQTTRRPVQLTAGPGILLYTLGDFMRQRAPGARHPIHLLTLNTNSATEALLEARADVAISVFPTPRRELVYHPWRVINQCVIMPRSHRLARREVLHPEDLQDEALIVAPSHKGLRREIEVVLAAHDVRWRVAVEATGWALTLRFVEYGMGLTITNDFVEVPETLVSIPISGFAEVHYEIARRASTLDEATLWLYDTLVTWQESSTQR